jgi:hypothetical protein
MENQTETVWVKDGAHCDFSVDNTPKLDGRDFAPEGVVSLHYIPECAEPIWSFNSTFFHGNTRASDVEKIEILTHHSGLQNSTSFDRIPECYFNVLTNYTDIASIYTASNPSNEAIHWLLADASGNSDCEKVTTRFTERFALVTINFAMTENATLIKDKSDQCDWPWLQCNAMGNVIQLKLRDRLLTGTVPNELALLAHLVEISVCKYIA